MFDTIGSFSVVYFTLAAVLFVLILFEKHFIRLEDKVVERMEKNRIIHKVKKRCRKQIRTCRKIFR